MQAGKVNAPHTAGTTGQTERVLTVYFIALKYMYMETLKDRDFQQFHFLT